MDVRTGLFYLFSAVLLFAAFRVITARNPVYAALFLVLTFFQAAGVWLLLRAEFLAISLVLVYVGAVMVLFLFVVMMLDINFVRLREGFLQYLPTGALLGIVLLAELGVLFGGWAFAPDVEALVQAPAPALDQASNTEALGRLLYTTYAYLFQASGLILLVAMVGTILLTLRSRTGVRKQNISAQIARTAKNSVEIRKVTTGGGI